MQNTGQLIKSCIRGDSYSQKKLYKTYFSYAMTICMQYSNNQQEAEEILNDAFLTVFKRLEAFDITKPFKPWLRRIIINKAIDYYRKNNKYDKSLDLEKISLKNNQLPDENIQYEDIMVLIQKLSPKYRMVFNLYVLEGYKHNEIAEKLGISVNTSKSNLFRARELLKTHYLINNKEKSI